MGNQTINVNSLKRVQIDELKAVAEDFNIVFKFKDPDKIKYDEKTTKAMLAKDIESCLKLIEPGDKFKTETEAAMKKLGVVLTSSTEKEKDSGKDKDTAEGNSATGKKAEIKKPEPKKPEPKKTTGTASAPKQTKAVSKNRLYYAGILVGKVFEKGGKINREELAEKARQEYIKAGGKDNIKEAMWSIDTAIKVFDGYFETVKK